MLSRAVWQHQAMQEEEALRHQRDYILCYRVVVEHP